MARRDRDKRDGEVDVEEVDVGTWGAGAWPPATGGAPLGGGQPPSGPPTAPPIALSPGADPDHVLDATVGSRPHGSTSGPATARPPTSAEPWTATATGPATGGAAMWLRAHARHVAAGVAAVVVLGTAVAIASGGGSDPAAAPTTSTAAPSTTEPRPISTRATTTTTEAPDVVVDASDGSTTRVPKVDHRFAVADVPEGWRTVDAQLLGDVLSAPWLPIERFFAAPDATWQTGPWLRVEFADGPRPSGAAFARPPLDVPLAAGTATVGAAPDGTELTVVSTDTGSIAITGRGLPPLQTVAVADRVTLAGGLPSLPADAIPAGLVERPELQLGGWSFGRGLNPAAYLMFSTPAWGATVQLTSGPADDMLATAPFFLSDVRYVLLGSPSDGPSVALAGTIVDSLWYGDDQPYPMLLWERDGRAYTASGGGDATIDDLVTFATEVVHPGSVDWRDTYWTALERERDETQEEMSSESDAVAPVDVPVAVAAAADAPTWTLHLSTVGDGSTAYWNFNSTNDGFGAELLPASPFSLRVVSRYGWVGGPEEFPAAAIAVVDPALAGSTLRLTTTGAVPQTVEILLQPVPEGVLGQSLAAGAVLPWTDGGFVAQLIAPDGQTIAVQTDGDLP